jgi:hypothetical protein
MTDQAALSPDTETPRRTVAEPVTDAESPRQTAKSQPVSLYPLSFEEAVEALVATPPMKDSQRRPPSASKPKTQEEKNGSSITVKAGRSRPPGDAAVCSILLRSAPL